jgi:hypothetical protein
VDCSPVWASIKNASPFFLQHGMEQTSIGEKHCARCFIDVIVFSKNLENHEQHLRQVLGRSRHKGVNRHSPGMRVGFPDGNYLGHKAVRRVVSTNGCQGQSHCEDAATNGHSGMNSCFRTANHYRKFVKDYSTIVAPLNILLGKMWHGTGLWDVRKLLTLSKSD